MNLKRLFLISIILTANMAIAQTWSTATATRPSDGHVIVYRYLEEPASDFDKSKQSERITLIWRYTGTNGMPIQAEREQMDDFEDHLDALMQSDKTIASLAFVSTGDDVRQWVYYTCSTDEFKKLLEKAQLEFPLIQIELDSISDPTWAHHEQFRRQVVR